MELNGKFYFEWPRWMGTVYAVDLNAVNLSPVVSLPDGTELQLYKNADGSVEVSETSTCNCQTAKFKAERIFDTRKESTPEFSGDWEPLIRLLNAASAVNTLFSVRLPPKEYQRLHEDKEAEFEALKQKLAPRAASLLHLVNFDGDLSVELYRTGRC